MRGPALLLIVIAAAAWTAAPMFAAEEPADAKPDRAVLVRLAVGTGVRAVDALQSVAEIDTLAVLAYLRFAVVVAVVVHTAGQGVVRAA